MVPTDSPWRFMTVSWSGPVWGGFSAVGTAATFLIQYLALDRRRPRLPTPGKRTRWLSRKTREPTRASKRSLYLVWPDVGSVQARRRCLSGRPKRSATRGGQHPNLDVHARRQAQALVQRLNRLSGRLQDVNKPLVRPNLKLLA